MCVLSLWSFGQHVIDLSPQQPCPQPMVCNDCVYLFLSCCDRLFSIPESFPSFVFKVITFIYPCVSASAQWLRVHGQQFAGAGPLSTMWFPRVELRQSGWAASASLTPSTTLPARSLHPLMSVCRNKDLRRQPPFSMPTYFLLSASTRLFLLA